MKRRSYLKAMLVATAGLSGAGAQAPKKQAQNPIVLHVDLSVDPTKEQEMLHNFHTIFKPAATKFPGYVDVKMCKLRIGDPGRPAQQRELPFPADVPERGAAAEMGGFRDASEGVANHREHTPIQELRRAAV